jgi:hypothetical protein
MAYAVEPPYSVQRTAVVDADTLQRFARFARYWDVLANSGRFAQTLLLLLQAPGQASPFWRFLAFSDWLWQRSGATHKLTPEALVDALFDYLSLQFPADTVRQALLADYVTSGARANPKALQGWLPRPAPSTVKSVRSLAIRQDRHAVMLPI